MAAHRGLFVGVVVVIAEDGDDRDRQARQLARDDCSLVRPAALRQVAGDEQHVRVMGEVFELRAQHAGGVGTEVDIGDGCDPDHDRSSPSVGSAVSYNVTWLCTS